MKSFQLTSLTELNKTISFTNPKSIVPNKFIFEHLKNGFYIGLMRLEKNGSSYNIAIDSIVIKDGPNIICEELNLVQLNYLNKWRTHNLKDYYKFT
jgi:hypothetical protein